MPKRGPTDTDRTTPPAEGEHEVEVVTADGERKPASLPKRVLAAARDTLSMTDQPPPRPPWLPGELDADGAEPDRAAAFEQTRRAALADDDDRTLVTGNTGIERAEQPPANVLTAYRQQHRANNARIAEQGMRNDAQLVDMDEQARRRVIDISHLFALGALRNEAAALLAADGWALVPKRLVSQFRAEIEEWERDLESGGS